MGKLHTMMTVLAIRQLNDLGRDLDMRLWAYPCKLTWPCPPLAVIVQIHIPYILPTFATCMYVTLCLDVCLDVLMTRIALEQQSLQSGGSQARRHSEARRHSQAGRTRATCLQVMHGIMHSILHSIMHEMCSVEA